MPVLVEAFSVIIKDSSINSKFKGGIDGFIDTIPNWSYCKDNDIHRIGFKTPDENRKYIQLLEQNGLTFVADNEFVDIAVVDMLTGATLKCSWLGFAREKFFEHTQFKNAHEFFSIAWFYDGNHGYGIPMDQNLEVQIALPYGWTPDEAIMSNCFVSFDNN